MFDDLPTERAAIAHICYGGEGGQLAAVSTLVAEFDKLGFSSAVVALGSPVVLKEDPGEWSDPRCLVSVPITRRGDIGSMVRVASAIRRTRPRVILCHSHRHALAGVVGQVLSGRRPTLVVVEHQSTHLRSKKDNVLSGLALAVSRGVVFLTTQYQERYPLRRLQEILGRPGFVVPNGIGATHRRSSGELRLAPKRRRTQIIGMASRLVPTKEHDVLIRAIHILHSRLGYDKVHLRIAGEGSTLQELGALAEKLGVAEFVHFVGHVPSSEIPSFLASLDVYAHATLGEGFSIALLEAAEAGVPIVVSDVMGVNEFFVDGETAVLVPASNPDAMAAGITRVLDSGVGSRLASAAREWILKNYSSDQMAAGYRAVLAAVDPSGEWLMKAPSR